MKFLNIIQLGFVFAGCFLGAGFVSGQELWQFFGIYGKNGFWGMILAIILFFIFGYIVLTLSQKTGIILMDEIVIPQTRSCSESSKSLGKLRNFIGFIQVFFIIGIYIIMCAGAGALINQLLGLHIIVGSSIFCFFVCFVSLKGIRGVINVFSLFVPPLILGAVIIGICAVNKNGFSLVLQENQDTIFKNPAISAIVYVSYNFFGSIGILAPVAQKYKKYKSKKILVAGTATGCLILTLISFCILMAMNTDRESTFSQLPMLFIAEKTNIFVGFAYAFFLLGAMFSTSLSSLVAVCEYVKEKYNFQRKKSAILTILLSFLACLLSLVGFDKLIGTIYPLCGIFGVFALVAIVAHYIKVEK